jgi:hypothetical protein
VGAADLDGNGLLDIVVSAWAGHIPNVYMNQGGLRFERIRLQGDADDTFANQGIAIVDVNRDRSPDIALTAFSTSRAQGSSGRGARERLRSLRGANGVHRSRLREDDERLPVRTASFQDFDNDADLGVVITGYHGSKQYRNNGEGRFNFVRRFEGVHYTAAFGDIDLDSDLDLYFAGDSGIYLNDGSGEFSFQDGLGLDGIGIDARSAVFADMDNDGDLDLLIASKQGPNTFFINEASAGGWLKVALTAPNGEKGAVGAEVALYRGEELVGYRVVQTATGYCSQDPSLAHFGVDPAGTYDLRVTFKEGTVATRTGLTPGQVVEVSGN